jgi:hypothetical protein
MCPGLEQFQGHVTTNEWLDTTGTKLLHDGGIQEPALKEVPVEIDPMIHVEISQGVQLETHTHKRSTSEVTRVSFPHPDSLPVTPK